MLWKVQRSYFACSSSTAIRELSKKIALFYNDQYIISVAKGLENEEILKQ